MSLDTLVNPTTVGTDVAGPMADFHPENPYSWPALRWAGTYSGPTDMAMLDAATNFDTSGFENPTAGTFGWSLDASQSNIVVDLHAVRGAGARDAGVDWVGRNRVGAILAPAVDATVRLRSPTSSRHSPRRPSAGAISFPPYLGATHGLAGLPGPLAGRNGCWGGGVDGRGAMVRRVCVSE